MSDAVILYYWDACMFIHHVHRKNSPAGLLDAIDDIAKKVDAMEVNLCTSAITFIEASRIRLLADTVKLARYDQLFNRRNIVPINVDPKITELAVELNDYYAPRGKTLGVADAIHLASAILYNAAEFHTVDGSGRGQKLLSLTPGGVIAEKYALKILQPKAGQARLTFE